MPRSGLVVVAILAVAAAARAQETPEDLRRRELIEQADAAAQAGDHARALEIAEQAARIRMTTSLRLFLAQEQAAVGRTVEGLAGAVRCGREAEADPTLSNRDLLLQTCGDLARELRGRVGTVVLAPPSPDMPGLRIVVSGVDVPREQWGRPWMVLPGRVEVEASVGGRTSWQELTVTAGQEVRVVVAAPVEEGRRPPVRRTAPEAPRAQAPEPSSSAGASAAWLALPFGLGAALAAAASVAGAMVLDRGDSYDQAVSNCLSGDGAACAGAPGIREEGEDLRLATNVLWIGAGVAAAVGVAMLLLVDLGGGEADLAAALGPSGAELHATARF